MGIHSLSSMMMVVSVWIWSFMVLLTKWRSSISLVENNFPHMEDNGIVYERTMSTSREVLRYHRMNGLPLSDIARLKNTKTRVIQIYLKMASKDECLPHFDIDFYLEMVKRWVTLEQCIAFQDIGYTMNEIRAGEFDILWFLPKTLVNVSEEIKHSHDDHPNNPSLI